MKKNPSKNITAEEFNRKMHECIKYKKLIELQNQLDWFGDHIGGKSIITLKHKIQQQIKEIPEDSIGFATEVHGQSSHAF